MIPYVSPQEFANAPTGLNLQTLVPAGTSADNSAELMRVLLRASGWIDNVCRMQLRATQNTETKRVWVGRDGSLTIYPNFSPVQQVVSLTYRTYPQQPWVTVNPANIEVLTNHFSAMDIYLAPASQVTVQYTYINGWPVATLTQAVTQGATTLTLDNTVGIASGTVLTIYDGVNTEQVKVSSVSGSSITLTAPVSYAHASSVHVSALPDDVRQACILVAASFIRDRRAGSIVMQGQTGHLSQSGSNEFNGLDRAAEILQPYKRVI